MSNTEKDEIVVINGESYRRSALKRMFDGFGFDPARENTALRAKVAELEAWQAKANAIIKDILCEWKAENEICPCCGAYVPDMLLEPKGYEHRDNCALAALLKG